MQLAWCKRRSLKFTCLELHKRYLSARRSDRRELPSLPISKECRAVESGGAHTTPRSLLVGELEYQIPDHIKAFACLISRPWPYGEGFSVWSSSKKLHIVKHKHLMCLLFLPSLQHSLSSLGATRIHSHHLVETSCTTHATHCLIPVLEPRQL